MASATRARCAAASVRAAIRSSSVHSQALRGARCALAVRPNNRIPTATYSLISTTFHHLRVRVGVTGSADFPPFLIAAHAAFRPCRHPWNIVDLLTALRIEPTLAPYGS